MSKSREDIVEELLKGMEGLELGSSDNLRYTRIPFNIVPLDHLIGGGIPTKRITLLTGPTNSGKSYLALQAARNAQQNGGIVGWIDAEMSWDPDWVRKCGVDPDLVLVRQSYTGEDALNAVIYLLDNSVSIVVLDSIAGLVPKAVMDEEFGYNPMAWQARFVNSALPKLMGHLRHGSALIVINQNRSSMGPVSLDNMPGGIGQTYFAHMILQVRRDGWIEEDKKKIGFDMKISMKKTKVGGEAWDDVIVPFRVEGGIDMTELAIRKGIELGQIEKSGAWFKYKDHKVQGLNGLRNLFIAFPNELEALKENVFKIAETADGGDGTGKEDSRGS